jgi:subtilisin family serine protease
MYRMAEQDAQAQPLDEVTLEQLHRLSHELCAERESQANTVTDELVLRVPSLVPGDAAEAQAVAGLDMEVLSQMMVGTLDEPLAPESMSGRQISERVVLLRERSGARVDLRPGVARLKSSRPALLDPQWSPPLGSELAASGVTIPTSDTDTRFEVGVVDPGGQPLAGMQVSGLLHFARREWVTAVTDAQGKASLGIPQGYARVEVVFVEPTHTYWSQYARGFARDEVRPLVFNMKPIGPDGFGLMAHYAPFDPAAGEGVTVGIIDSGVGPHADLAVAGGACFVEGEDPAGFADSGMGHGTFVAGIVAARRSAAGTYGIAPACRLMSYRVFRSGGEGSNRAKSPDVAAALYRAIEDGCDLVNISLGSRDAMDEVRGALARARASGIAVIVSTGNDGQALRYPARYPHALAVAALGRSGTFPDNAADRARVSKIVDGGEFVGNFSNFGGPGTHYIGPGVAVLSTWPGDCYAAMSGTSMSAPFVTGMAARRLSRVPELLKMERTAARADAIARLMSDKANNRKPQWADDYGLYGVPI